jgi:hypothetical protein
LPTAAFLPSHDDDGPKVGTIGYLILVSQLRAEPSGTRILSLTPSDGVRALQRGGDHGSMDFSDFCFVGSGMPVATIKGPFGTVPAPDSKRGSRGAVPNEYFFKLILAWSQKIESRFCEQRWDLKKPAPPSLKTAPQPTKYGSPLKV